MDPEWPRLTMVFNILPLPKFNRLLMEYQDLSKFKHKEFLSIKCIRILPLRMAQLLKASINQGQVVW